MPYYDYICEKCGYEIEIKHSMKESYTNNCPNCKDIKLKKKLYAVEINMGDHKIIPRGKK